MPTKFNSTIQIHCKCGCEKLPSTGYRGYNFACVPEELRQELTKNKVSKRKQANAASLKRKLYKVQQKAEVPNLGLKRASKPISKNSKKRLEELKIYRVLRKDYLKDFPVCEVEDCKSKSVEIHHKKGRGILLNVVEYWMAICRKHHNWIGDNPKQAMELGLTISRLKRTC